MKEGLTVLSLTVFTQRNCVADLLQVKCTFQRKTTISHFYTAGVKDVSQLMNDGADGHE